jgi:predicted nucleic-acid-binding protein
MIGVDTNVILRYIVRDDEEQAAKADRLFRARTADDPAFVSSIVLCELIWVLRRVYSYDRAAVCNVLEQILFTEGFAVSNRTAILAAFISYQSGHIDFADCLLGLLNRDVGCSTTVTFDEIAGTLPEFEML